MTEHTDLRAPQFTSAQVAYAADCTDMDIKNWVRRGVLQTEMEPGRPGRRRRFTRENAYEIALISVLRHVGIKFDSFGGWIQTVLEQPDRAVALPATSTPETISQIDMNSSVRRLLGPLAPGSPSMIGHGLGHYVTTVLDVPGLLSDVDESLDQSDEE